MGGFLGLISRTWRAMSCPAVPAGSVWSACRVDLGLREACRAEDLRLLPGFLEVADQLAMCLASMGWTAPQTRRELGRLTLHTNIEPGPSWSHGRRFSSTNQEFSGSMLVFQGVIMQTPSRDCLLLHKDVCSLRAFHTGPELTDAPPAFIKNQHPFLLNGAVCVRVGCKAPDLSSNGQAVHQSAVSMLSGHIDEGVIKAVVDHVALDMPISDQCQRYTQKILIPLRLMLAECWWPQESK